MCDFHEKGPQTRLDLLSTSIKKCRTVPIEDDVKAGRAIFAKRAFYLTSMLVTNNGNFAECREHSVIMLFSVACTSGSILLI